MLCGAQIARLLASYRLGAVEGGHSDCTFAPSATMPKLTNPPITHITRPTSLTPHYPLTTHSLYADSFTIKAAALVLRLVSVSTCPLGIRPLDSR